MLRVPRPSFELVKEGLILKKIKQLQRHFVIVFFWCQVGTNSWVVFSLIYMPEEEFTGTSEFEKD